MECASNEESRAVGALPSTGLTGLPTGPISQASVRKKQREQKRSDHTFKEMTDITCVAYNLLFELGSDHPRL